MSKESDTSNNDDDGMDLWEKVIATVKSYAPHSPKPKTPRSPKQQKPSQTSVVTVSPTPLPPQTPAQMDPATDKKFKSGKLQLEARLDLHGMTQNQAHKALENFLASCIAKNKRTILVITGKGADTGGVLQRMVPMWLESSRFQHNILSVSHATPKDGGSGALYIRLKKQR